MENLFKSLLKNYGYDHIGIVNENKKIWGFVKDGRFHLCKENLEEVSRSEAQINEGVLVLILKNDVFSIVENIRPFFQSYLVIDDNNNLLDIKEEGGDITLQPTYGIKRINNNSVILLDRFADNRNHIKRNTGTEVIELVDKSSNDRVFLDGKFEFDLRYVLQYEDYYFFINKNNSHNITCFIYEPFLGQIYKGDVPRLWIRENKSPMLIFVKEKMVTLSHIDGSQRKEFLLPQSHLEHNFSKEELFVFEDTITIPFWGSKGSRWNSRDDGAMVISNTRNWCVDFTNGGDRIEKTENNIIALRSWKSSYETFYYDIYGSFLGKGSSNYLVYEKENFTYYNPKDKKSLKEFWQNDFGHDSVKLKGVMRLDDYCIVVPPIFERIKVINSESILFEVTFAYWSNGERKEMKGLYSEDGIIGALGIEIEYLNYELLGWSSYLEKPKTKEFRRQIPADGQIGDIDKTEFIVYSYENKKGLVYRGKTITGLEFDDIRGYTVNLQGGYTGNYLGEDEDVLKYFPSIAGMEIHSCLLYKGGKVGIFVSDKLYSNIEYDQVTVVYSCKNLYYKVSKGGKESILNDKLEELVPFRNESVDFIFPTSYISGGKLYNMRHQMVFDLHSDDFTTDKESTTFAYELVDWDWGSLAFQKRNEYVFYLYGKIVVKKVEECDENDFIELYKETNKSGETYRFCFSTHENKFFDETTYPEVEEYEGPSSEPYTAEELEQMYWDAFDGDPGNYWNID